VKPAGHPQIRRREIIAPVPQPRERGVEDRAHRAAQQGDELVGKAGRAAEQAGRGNAHDSADHQIGRADADRGHRVKRHHPRAELQDRARPRKGERPGRAAAAERNAEHRLGAGLRDHCP
jgi:hypothetical protein